MTLYDLANATTAQGNIEVRIFDDSDTYEAAKILRFSDSGDLSCESIFRGKTYKGKLIEDMRVEYMFAIEGLDRLPWLVVEVKA